MRNVWRDHAVTARRYDRAMSTFAREKHFIRAWRKFRGHSLRRFADMLEGPNGEPLMSHANIGRIETGEQPYTQDFLEAAARALNASPVDLLTVDPSKEGEVIDILRLLREKKDAQTLAVLRALAEKSA